MLLIIFGLLIAFTAITIFPSESTWGSVYSMLGVIIFTIGIAKSTRNLKYPKRLLITFLTLLGMIGILMITDDLNVKTNKTAPRFRYTAYFNDGNVYYDKLLFYDVIKCGDEYNIIKNQKITNIDDINWCEED